MNPAQSRIAEQPFEWTLTEDPEPSGQVEGAIHQGLSTALHERITIEAGGVVETNFHAYSLLRIDEAPARIDVHFVDRPDAQISGLGESALPPVAPALANALYRATGRRFRELPLHLA